MRRMKSRMKDQEPGIDPTLHPICTALARDGSQTNERLRQRFVGYLHVWRKTTTSPDHPEVLWGCTPIPQLPRTMAIPCAP